MASIKNLKKDINYVLGDVIDYAIENAKSVNDPKKAEPIIDEAISTFDALITRVNSNKGENIKAHFKQVKADLESKANALLEQVNQF